MPLKGHACRKSISTTVGVASHAGGARDRTLDQPTTNKNEKGKAAPGSITPYNGFGATSQPKRQASTQTCFVVGSDKTKSFDKGKPDESRGRKARSLKF